MCASGSGRLKVMWSSSKLPSLQQERLASTTQISETITSLVILSSSNLSQGPPHSTLPFCPTKLITSGFKKLSPFPAYLVGELQYPWLSQKSPNITKLLSEPCTGFM